MNMQMRDHNHNQTVENWVHGFVEGLNTDLVGLWQIAGNGRLDFKFSDTELQEYIAVCVEALVTAGASPVTCGKPITRVVKYGNSAKQIANEVAIDWKTDSENLELDLWFALPAFYSTRQS